MLGLLAGARAFPIASEALSPGSAPIGRPMLMQGTIR